jgi:hypothetical protein
MGCQVCAAGEAAQLAGALPHGVPLCTRHAAGGRMRVITRRGPFHFYGLPALLLWLVTWGLRLVVTVVVVAVRRPRTTAAAVVLCATGWAVVVHPLVVLTAATVAVELAGTWSVTAPPSWRAAVRARVGLWWRAAWVYRRQWQVAVLVAELDRDGRLPRLGRVQAVGTVDHVRVRALLGQRFDEWEAAGPMLAHVFGATDVRVHRGDDRRLTLELERGRRGSSWNREGYDLGADL